MSSYLRGLMPVVPLSFVVGALFAGAGEVEASPLHAHAVPNRCAKGSVSAVIAGKHVCLKVGQACKRSLDKRYHVYKFHCHRGRLTRMTVASAPKPPAPPPPQPSLPGQRVDVGGYRLYIECIGSGSPTVIFEAGQGGAAATAPLGGATGIRQAIAAETRVCAYDRAGFGASEARPATVAPTGTQYAQELHALLAGAGAPGPYVLVGPSYGGLVIAAYASQFPSETAGLVFVDSDTCNQTCTYGAPESGTFDLASATFGSRPIVVLLAEFGSQSDGRNLVSRSSNPMLVTAIGSGHPIIADQPQVVTEATRLVVAAARTGSALPPCEQTRIPAVGGRCEPTG